MITVPSIILTILFFVVTPANAGEISEWIKAAASVLLHHEAGHYVAGQSAGFELSGKNGLTYNLTSIEIPAQPSAANYSGYTLVIKPDGSRVGYLPPDQYSRWQSDTASWETHYGRQAANRYRLESGVGGAGFVAQQRAVESSNLSLPVYRKSLILSGVFQGGYIAYHYLDRGNYGDIARMRHTAPDALIITSLALSSLSDIYRGSQSQPPSLRLGFLSDVSTGAVGLTLSGAF